MSDLDPIQTESDIDYDTPAEMPDGQAEALERASWHLRMASQLTAERDQIAGVYKAELERLAIRLGHRSRILNDQIAWHERPVEALHRALLADSPKRKTIELPYGTSKMRTPKTARLEIVDRPKLLSWAEDSHPDILGRTINVTGVKTVAMVTDDLQVLTEHGEVIPGVEAVLDDPSWSVNYDE